MNNERFKRFIGRFVDDMLDHMGGEQSVRETYKLTLNEITHYIAGGVFGLVLASARGVVPFWRDDVKEDYMYAGVHLVLNQEEVRRVLDLVRLRLETGSATS